MQLTQFQFIFQIGNQRFFIQILKTTQHCLDITLVSKNQTKTWSELEVGLGPEPSPWFFKNQNQTGPEIPVFKNWNQEF